MKYSDVLLQVPKQDFQADLVSVIHQAQSTQSLGDLAYQTLTMQFQYILAQEHGVIKDIDPEYLHQMRVGFRKLQAAITVFSDVITCPATLKLKDCKQVLRNLGTLRDLDVQLEGLTQKIRKAPTPGNQRRLMRLQRDLTPERRWAYKQVCKTLSKRQTYKTIKGQMNHWLKHPQYQAIASLPVGYAAPDLLSPLMSRLLLHPAWLISLTAMTPAQLNTLHDLRKLCKQLRYQTEFFQPFYPKAFKTWIKEIKGIQSALGQLQDACVFAQLIEQYPEKTESVTLRAIASPTHAAITHLENAASLTLEWDQLRQHYSSPIYRRQLHELILSPLT